MAINQALDTRSGGSTRDARVAGAVVYAKDVQRVSRFYAEIVGLTVAQEEQGFVVLQSHGFELVVVAMSPAVASQVSIASPPRRRENTAVKLCFPVPSIARARESAAQFGGELNRPEREWEFRGRRVCDGHDPEGNVIQLWADAR